MDVSCNGGNEFFGTLSTVSSKTVIHLDHCIYDLISLLTISNKNDLRIIGSGNGTVINCTSNNAGLLFNKVNNLLLESLTIQNCGAVFGDDSLQIASVKIEKGNNLTITNVTIENGTGTGLSLVNIKGVVTVENCIFRHNLYYVDRTYRVVNDFTQRGGGMRIQVGLIQAGLEDSIYFIQKCKFLFNFASSGGGLFVVVQPFAMQNTITVKNSDFINNICQNGGGGIQIGYTAARQRSVNKVINNSITFQNCVFRGNEAGFGGGTAIFSSETVFNNIFQLNNCLWSKNNAAKHGMAVDIAITPWETYVKKTIFPSPTFKNCTFTEHTHSNFFRSPGRSTFAVKRFKVNFKERILFEGNSGTALEATSAVLEFVGSKAMFIGNRGIDGGSVKLKGYSVIFAYARSQFVFWQNKAVKSGGAIYVDPFGMQTSCFIQTKSKIKKEISFIFKNNTAGLENSRHGGDSIYASSLLPCLERCSQLKNFQYNVSVSKALECIGDFEFDEISPRRQLTSGAHHFSRIDITNEQDKLCKLFIVNSTIYSNQNYSLKDVDYHIDMKEKFVVVPGKATNIPLKLVDELCGEVFFRVSVEVLMSDQGSIFIDSTHSILTNNYITLYGNPHDFGTLQFSAVGVSFVTLVVKLDDCLPGYVHEHLTKSCVCSSANLLHYDGIEKCSESNFTAYVQHGYWLGYLTINETRQDRLASAICPKGFCITSGEHPLTNVSLDDLSPYICNEKRKGVICGSCKNITLHIIALLHSHANPINGATWDGCSTFCLS